MPSWILWAALLSLPAKALLVRELWHIGRQARRGLNRPGPLFHPDPPRAHPEDEALPVTVLVAYHNEAKALPRLLDCLALQSCGPQAFRVILVDDHSDDGGPGSLAEPGASVLRTQWLQNPGRGKTAALAHGAATVDRGIIVYTDGDCRPEPDWVDAHRRAHARGARLVLGHIRVRGSALAALESLVASAQLLGASATGRPPFSRGGNWSLRAEDLRACGGYTGLEGLPSGDDLYLLQRLLALKPPLACLGAPGSRVHTDGPGSGHSAAQQRRRRYGKLPGLSPGQRLRHLLLALALVALAGEGLAALAGRAPWGVAQAGFVYLLALAGLRDAARLLGENARYTHLALGLLLWPPLMLGHGLWGTLAGYRWKHAPTARNTR